MCLLSSHQFISYPSPQPISSVHRLRCPTILKMSIIALIINIMPPPSSPQFSEFGRRLGSGRNFIEEVSSDEGFNIRAAVVASLEIFGVPLEIIVQRQQSTRPVPQVLTGMHSCQMM
ncbi:uncharacterized protein LOC109849605 isoform X2 [Asparagus officinalis]|uniref:uncharacterized protein LOC109849605 isoform X2 n=1 Tax=Asparagus officinalis TaxID=4686 RepID=UPI00098E5D7A|nr:uncharacterized protein LOC109849605 isoform X2 [Asparagus officinalis]